MKQTNIKRESPIGIRPNTELRSLIEKIAKDERRTTANVVVYIVDQYLSSTNGQLLKRAKVIEEQQAV
jgi:hypothetical protein